jgi:hypothetical protein
MTKILAWKPDYLVHNEVEDFHVPKKFWPTSMTSDVRRLVKCWAELCRFVMLQLGCSKEFGVGVIFSGSMLAAYKRQHSPKLNRELDWLLINPMPKLTRGEDKQIIDPRDDEQLLNLYAMAIHEATHMADEVSDHDVSFAAALTANIARTYGQEKRIRAIRRSVLKYDREVKAEIREAKRAEPAPVAQKFEQHKVFIFDERNPTSSVLRRRIWETYTADGAPVLVAFDEYPGEGRVAGLWEFSHDRFSYFEYTVPSELMVDFIEQVVNPIHKSYAPTAGWRDRGMHELSVAEIGLSTALSIWGEWTLKKMSASDFDFVLEEARHLPRQ